MGKDNDPTVLPAVTVVLVVLIAPDKLGEIEYSANTFALASFAIAVPEINAVSDPTKVASPVVAIAFTAVRVVKDKIDPQT
jgi:hypothetical protein